MDLRQSSQYANFMRLIGWLVEKVNGDYIYIRKIPLTPFSVVKVQRPKIIPFKKINQLAKKYRAIAIYLEPDAHAIGNWHSEGISRSGQLEIRKYGFRLSKSPFLPAKTIHLDLTQPEGKILAGMKKDARYGIRKAKKEALQLIKAKDLAKFHQAWKRSASWNRWVPSLKSLQVLKKTFGKNAIFLTAQCNNGVYYTKLLAGIVILTAGKTAYYYYAFTSKEGRKKLAQHLLIWEAIKEAKKRDCQIFDFEGIYDERFPQKSWKGFSHFKEGFGGKEIEYVGCFVKYRFLFRSRLHKGVCNHKNRTKFLELARKCFFQFP